MKNITLIKGLSYTYQDKRYVKDESFLVDEDTATYLISTGHFIEDSGAAEPGTSDNTTGAAEPALTAQMIDDMKKDELEALADKKNIDIKDCKTNADKAERIKGALGLVNFNHLDFGK